MDNLVTLTHKSTHCYLVDTPGGKLLIDTGWAGELPAFKSNLKTHTIEPREIKFVMFTHHHPDHAGGAQEIKKLCGARLLIHEKQIPFLADLHAFYASKGSYELARVEKNDVVIPTQNRALLKSLGIHGEIVETPGHSDDSVSLVLDSGLAFIGDLHPPDLVGEEEYSLVCESWKKMLRLHPRTFYPGHGTPFPAAVIQNQLPPT